MLENKSIQEHLEAFRRLLRFSEFFSFLVLTFDFLYGIKIKRFEDIVLPNT